MCLTVLLASAADVCQSSLTPKSPAQCAIQLGSPAECVERMANEEVNKSLCLLGTWP